jgi:trehalose 6-phosphate synthase
MPPNIVIVANRGPRDFVWRHGRWAARTSAGGVVSMLAPLARQPNVAWYCCVSEPPDAETARAGLFTMSADQADPTLHVVPVPLPAKVYQGYYGRISNEVLWMLQHHLIGPGGYAQVDYQGYRAWEDGYLAANRSLAAVVAEACASADACLVQDYHLYALPALLRASCPGLRILHFTHIPFPEPSVLRLLPPTWRETLLHGMLGADVVGLQTPSDVRAFLDCCSELLGVAVDPVRATVTVEQRRVLVRAYPASVNPAALQRTMRSAALTLVRERLSAHLGPLNVIRVDRLDPSKNQVNGFLAFARLLAMRPDLQGRVRFLAFLVPSRTDLEIYRAYRDTVYQTIEAINAQYGAACGHPPIEVFYTNDREQALAAMEACDVLLVNSIRDGMNLVAKEWAVVSQRPGVLVVSETAGVVEEAGASALPVCPLDIEGTAQALAVALDMPASERAARLARFRARIYRYTAWHWLSTQLTDLGLGAVLPRERQ